ncbi:MAG TPA: DUF2378 family protein [Polyangiaceae bacterium]|jgi:uncharacterized protein (TIGR02265 family)|nr:DUF2378 family protein [Polyangiaceae bacterium]
MALQTRTAKADSTLRLSSLTTNTESRTINAKDTWAELEARVDEAPADAKIRGMFLRDAARLGNSAESAESRYVPFSMYPARDYMRLLLKTARAKFPNKVPACALLELGLRVYPLFASSIAGTAIFAVVNVDFKRLCEVAPRGYSVTLKPGSAKAAQISDAEATIHLRDVWIFPEIFHAGVWLGAMEATKVKGSIDVTRHSLSDVDLHLRWQPK